MSLLRIGRAPDAASRVSRPWFLLGRGEAAAVLAAARRVVAR